MSIGTAIVIVGAMFFVLVSTVLGFCFVQWRKMEAERRESIRESIREIEERRADITRGARRTDTRFKL